MDNQCKKMLKYDRKSIRKQQNIRDNRGGTMIRVKKLNIKKRLKII